MLKKIFLIFFALILTVVLFEYSKSHTTHELSIPSNHTSIANKLGFGDHYKKYIVDGNNDVCVYTLDEEIVFLLVTENVSENQFPCYGDSFTKEIGGTPIAIADDLHSIIIENADGKFEVSVTGIDTQTAPSTVAEFNQDGNNFIRLYAE